MEKLGFDRVSDAIESLTKFYDNVQTKPKFMCVINAIHKQPTLIEKLAFM